MLTTSSALILVSGILILISGISLLLVRWKKKPSPEMRYLPSTPILFTSENEDGWVIQDDLFCIYGIGDTFAEAAQDYIKSGKEYYWLLKKEPDTDKQRLLYIRNWDKIVRRLVLAIEAREEAEADEPTT